ncbi:Alpha/beta hydrolase family protein [compost metagenome]
MREFPQLPRERFTVEVPTLVLWAMDDVALLPGLLEGLDDYVPRITIKRVAGATHWVVHEQPDLVAREIERFCAQ